MTDPSRANAPLILVVDDIADARLMYSLYLTNHGFRVVEAANGEDAVRLAHEQHPALVLMDLGMPVMDGDGWEATRRIKADPRTRSVPVLAVSGHALADSVKQAKDSGVDAIFRKPCLPAVVLAKINEMLGLSD
nr:Response regulator receiver domain protein [uncultured bacterium]